MGWTVLYIAFGIVALWLLGEVLLQYKARLRWRLLAFGGFLGVVVGVLIPSVVVIALGAVAFAVGQTYVTLSFRRGFSTGWAIGNRGESGSRRRRDEPRNQDPTLEVSDLEETVVADGSGQPDDPFGPGNRFDEDDDVFVPQRPAPSEGEATAVYSPQPLPDETGSYGVYTDAAYAAANDPTYAAAAHSQDQSFGYDGYDQQQYGYSAAGHEQQQYAAYSDPYAGTQGYDDGGYGTGYADPQAYGAQQGHGQDQYGTGTYGETPPGGVWVPQQRTTDHPAEPAHPADVFGTGLPQEQPYPYQGDAQGAGNGYGYDGQQYRY
ncbi:hypothetical protein GCM10010145_41000 [Streptomyces ruber]|uniref:Uncharacterized protein n=2 Tax=Streptomyces TaxID=1883 RepID=A0A918BHX3_9ACTN|nr:hypothetical protein [Streptomyces ruber]GGQ67061.1 hypothetical protein GCM10010145_41000 [Streptomyces ruber]